MSSQTTYLGRAKAVVYVAWVPGKVSSELAGGACRSAYQPQLSTSHKTAWQAYERAKGRHLTCDRCRADFKNMTASLLINANSTAFDDRSTSQFASYMSNPVVRGTTCMVQHQSCAHRRANTCYLCLSDASYLTKPITRGTTCLFWQTSLTMHACQPMSLDNARSSAAADLLHAAWKCSTGGSDPLFRAPDVGPYDNAAGLKLGRCCAGAAQRQCLRPCLSVAAAAARLPLVM